MAKFYYYFHSSKKCHNTCIIVYKFWIKWQLVKHAFGMTVIYLSTDIDTFVLVKKP